MNNSISVEYNFPQIKFFSLQMLGGAFLIILSTFFSIYAQTNVSLEKNNEILIVENAKESEIFAFGKTVIIKNEAKGVLSFGGDVIVEGRVSGDVAAIGGSVIQKENAFIGGDVIIFGGTYRPEAEKPLRNAEKETIMYAGYEKELRSLSKNPAEIFTPDFSWSFLAQRFLSILFWFIISFALTTIAPGAVSRAVAGFQLSTLKVIAVGFFTFVGTTLAVMFSVSFLPNFVSVIVIPMLLILLMLAFVFGRVALQVSVGKRLQKRFLPENYQSETLAILIGVIVWTIFLSVPYLWIFALLALFSASVGLVLTARSKSKWENSG